ncbi:MAG: acyl-CoA dehydrogenase C-terminal domain-containing protein [Gammaproteobacteria bacterium]
MANEYTAPTTDLLFNLKHLVDLEELSSREGFEEASPDMAEAILEEAGRFASEVFAPINPTGDQQGNRLEGDEVSTAGGFAEAYGQFMENGWQALEAPVDFGGQGFPKAVGSCATEIWNSANASLALCPLLTAGAIEALEQHASDELKATYLEKLVSGEWTGTMNLTEPGAGSDLAAVRSKAIPEDDHYRISGTKIFISWGEHGMTENIIHLVLARLPDAPEGTRGISLFLVPKFMVNDDGSLGERNDVKATSLEHKLGIHGSPTCVMNFGDADGAIGYLIGEENKGLACMFTMMNAARLGVGVQGLAVGERAYQGAVAYARERVQAKTIIEFPDVARMLLTMRALTEAGRGVALTAMAAFDRAANPKDEAEQAGQQARVDLLTPIVKGWLTENGQEITSLGVQVHGGMGYVEETGAAQHMRDARIFSIYEGTNGIQALDLVGRKTLKDGGAAMRTLLDDMRAVDVSGTDLAEDYATLLNQATEGLNWLLEQGAADRDIPATVAFPYLMLMGTVCGGWVMARQALAAQAELDVGEGDPAFMNAKLKLARFYFDHIAPRADGYLRTVKAGTRGVTDWDREWF